MSLILKMELFIIMLKVEVSNGMVSIEKILEVNFTISEKKIFPKITMVKQSFHLTVIIKQTV